MSFIAHFRCGSKGPAGLRRALQLDNSSFVRNARKPERVLHESYYIYICKVFWRQKKMSCLFFGIFHVNGQ